MDAISKKSISFSLNTKIFLLLLSVLNTMTNTAQNHDKSEISPLAWSVGHASTNAETPTVWYSAVVPGAVQLDLAKALQYGPYYYAENWKDYGWMEDQFFTYRSAFSKPVLEENQHCFFVSKGIDYEFEIWLNGEKLFYQEGMFTPVELDITSYLKDQNELLVKIFPIPKLHKLPADRTQASQSVKPAVSYGWDWHPRLVPVGIWDETGLVVRNQSNVSDVDFSYTLDKALKTAKIAARISGTNLQDCRYVFSITDANSKVVFEKKKPFSTDTELLTDSIENIQLWWSHDHGNPYLYTLEMRLFDKKERLIQQHTRKIGFRKVQLVMNEGAWSQPSEFPKSQSVAPIQVELNGRKIFCKGSNWVNPEIFPGIITTERYDELLSRVKEANFNIVRVWGGGIVNKEAFYDLCDEKGILVWQEFPLACNNYEGTPHYLKLLEQESTSIINRLKKHPSLAIWCGGNELFNNWSKMTNQSLALRLLNSQCYQLDPTTPYIATSPLMGMGHGHYLFRDWQTKKEVYEWMPKAKCTAYTEFGVPSPASVEVLKTIIPENELWPPKRGTSWQSHHAFKAWVDSTWLMPEMLTDYFGEAQNLEELVANGQLIQSEGYKCIYEEARRQKLYCSMALNWCFNEPWPTAANNSLINWPNKPKPAFYAVKNACRPFLASARLKKLKYTEGEEFVADLWVLNDVAKRSNKGKMLVKLVADKEERILLTWEFDALNENTNLAGPTVRCILPNWQTDRFKLVLEVEGHPEYNSEYTLLYETLIVKRKKQNLLNF